MARASRKPPFWAWLTVVLLLTGGLLVVFERRVSRSAPEPGPPPPAPRTLAEVKPHEALEVELLPADDDASGLPQVAVRFGECSWLLAHPEPGSLPEVTAAWNRLVPVYEAMCDGFAEEVRAVRAREPDRRVGIIRTRGDAQAVPDTVVEFVRDAFRDAEVYDVLVER